MSYKPLTKEVIKEFEFLIPHFNRIWDMNDHVPTVGRVERYELWSEAPYIIFKKYDGSVAYLSLLQDHGIAQALRIMTEIVYEYLI